MSESRNEPKNYDADPASFGTPSEGRYVPEPEPEHRPLRVGTIVWGLVLAAVGALILTVQLTGIRLDAGMVLLGLLIGAGTALVIGGLLAVMGRKRS
ncbi:hypothetical protein [Arthrobacter sp. BL-252-APC-1A]|uniref:hypothetical protein n=1 Tax=Arthrobacter sp. BL-252-APC-1A TaxID=2606622 RepID=UPI001E60CFFA|nr:hypothetical protein [Arthrobacter sp. BL-252-APC-1A]